MSATSQLNRCLSCRVTDGEHDRFWEVCRAQEIAPSQYLRYLMRLVFDRRWDGSTGAVLIDRQCSLELAREFKKQGYNLNQGIHALNAIAQYYRQDKSDTDWLKRQFDTSLLAFNTVVDGHEKLLALMNEINAKMILGGD